VLTITAVTRARAISRIAGLSGGLLAAAALFLMRPARGDAAERDLYFGLAYLRPGAQTQGERQFVKYRDEEPDATARRNVDRIFPLLKQPLSQELRDYIAVTLEASIRSRLMPAARSPRPSYASRMFPVCA
jgi:hypothetical protein